MADLDDEETAEDILRQFEYEQNEYWNEMIPPEAKDAFQIFSNLVELTPEYKSLHEKLRIPLMDLGDLAELRVIVAKLLSLHKSLTRRALIASRFK